MRPDAIAVINELTNELRLVDGTVVKVPDVNRYTLDRTVEQCDEICSLFEAGEDVHAFCRFTVGKKNAPLMPEEAAKAARGAVLDLLHMVGWKPGDEEAE